MIRKRKKRLQRYKNKALVYILLLFLIILYFQYTKQSQRIITPLGSNPDTKKQTQLSSTNNNWGNNKQTKEKNTDDLKQRIILTINNKWINYSVYVKDMYSDFTVDINGSVIYPAASVSKIPILAVLYYKTDTEGLDLDTKITIQQADIQDYGTGTIQYDPPGTQYSYKTLAQLMMKKSDNTAAYVFSKYILGLNNIQSRINAWGLTQTNMNTNHTSNKDMAILMERMFNGDIANTALTEEMLALTKDSDFENRLPKLLPEGVQVYHKIGNGVGVVHDVGIVQTENAAYYIGVLTSDIHDEEQAKQMTAEISYTVYEYMTKN